MPNGWCITTMTYWCSWLRLMVASASEADRFSMKNKLSSISALCLLPTKMISFVSSPWLSWTCSHLSHWCNFITQLAMNQIFPRIRIDVGTKSISFVLISKPAHNFVSSSSVILFVQLLTLIKKWCGLKTRMDIVSLHFYLLRILDLTAVKLCKVWPSLGRTQQTIIVREGKLYILSNLSDNWN